MKNPRSLINEKKKYQTNKFTLHHEQVGRWKVSGRDFEGKYRRVRFDAKDLNEAMKKAEEILAYGEETTQQQTSSNDCPPIQIADALIRSCKNQNWTEYTREQELTNCKYFLRWIDEKKLTYWHELQFEHIQEYKHFLESRQLAYDTVRLYLLPVRRAARWAAANWPKEYSNICQGLRLSRKHSTASTYDENHGNPFLSIHEVLGFLDYLSRDPARSQLTIGVSLQGLMGLQMQEALRLTWEKVDLNDETITIDGIVKNQYRIRKIPVVSVVSWLLRQTFDNQAKESLVITNYANYDNYSHAVKRELKRWNQEASIKPKDLRNTIQTEAIDGGWYGYYVQRYVGHAPQTIGERHYHGDQGKRLISWYREKVINPIEEVIKTWEAPTDSSIIPGPRLAICQ